MALESGQDAAVWALPTFHLLGDIFLADEQLLVRSSGSCIDARNPASSWGLIVTVFITRH